MIEIDLNAHLECNVLWKYWRTYLADQRESAYAEAVEIPSKSFNATARNRMRFAERKKYVVWELSWTARNNWLDDIHAINNSVPERQGREMSAGYKEFPSKTSGVINECLQHRSRFFCVFTPDGTKLIGYINACYCGDMVAASQILGHADYLEDGIMLLLWNYFVKVSYEAKFKHVIYSRWSDGTKGLKYWKHSVGMQPEILREKL